MLQAAVYDADVNDQDGNPAKKPDNNYGTNWSMGGNGVVLASEIHFYHDRYSTEGLPGVFKLGGFFMNGEYQEGVATA